MGNDAERAISCRCPFLSRVTILNSPVRSLRARTIAHHSARPLFSIRNGSFTGAGSYCGRDRALVWTHLPRRWVRRYAGDDSAGACPVPRSTSATASTSDSGARSPSASAPDVITTTVSGSISSACGVEMGTDSAEESGCDGGRGPRPRLSGEGSCWATRPAPGERRGWPFSLSDRLASSGTVRSSRRKMGALGCCTLVTLLSDHAQPTVAARIDLR